MANPEHLLILEQGVEAWNVWRIKMRGITPDLNDERHSTQARVGKRASLHT